MPDINAILETLKTDHAANVAATYTLIVGWFFGFITAKLISYKSNHGQSMDNETFVKIFRQFSNEIEKLPF